MNRDSPEGGETEAYAQTGHSDLVERLDKARALLAAHLSRQQENFPEGFPLAGAIQLLEDAAAALTAADEEIARLREALTWRSIETAPKDRPIIVWCVHQLAKYCKDPASEGYEAPAIARWIDHNGGGWTWHGLAGPPTLWMPLPSGPLAAAPKAGGSYAA